MHYETYILLWKIITSHLYMIVLLLRRIEDTSSILLYEYKSLKKEIIFFDCFPACRKYYRLYDLRQILWRNFGENLIREGPTYNG